MQRRNWCITINNWEDSDLESLYSLEPRYFVAGKEGKDKTPHLQVYIEFRTPWRFNRLKKALPTAHIEPRRGSRFSASEYCKKEGDFVEHGQFIDNGARTDLQEVQTLIDGGVSERIIAQEHFGTWTRNYRAFERYRLMTVSNGLRDVNTIVYHGVPGSGKTYKAFMAHDPDDIYILHEGNNCNVWFDGYTGQSVLLIDDFNNWIEPSFLLRMLDKYPLNIETKGGSQRALWTTVYITSNTNPQEWVSWSDALKRRIHNNVYFPEKWDSVINKT